MARITVEDCLTHVDNRFELIMVASKRAHQLATGGHKPLAKHNSDKPSVIALRELAENLITPDDIDALDEKVNDEFSVDEAFV